MEGLKRFQGLIDENPQDFRPYLCQVSLSEHASNVSAAVSLSGDKIPIRIY